VGSMGNEDLKYWRVGEEGQVWLNFPKTLGENRGCP